jgi:DNA-binding XRE family transcriptional regulator
MTKHRRTTSDGLAILDRHYFEGRPARVLALAEATLNAQIAQEIYALRAKAGLTQRQLADLVGTTDSVILRLEDTAYTGHSLKML